MTILIYIIPILIGYLIIRLWQNKIKFLFLEKLALGFGLGTSAITYVLFLLSLFGVRFSQLNILILSIGLSVILFVISQISQPFRILNFGHCCPMKLGVSRFFRVRKVSIQNLVLFILILIVVFKIGYVFTEAYLRPVIQFDAVANWSMRARVFFFQEKIPINPQEPYWLGAGGHENYPLHLSLLELWATKILGFWHEPTIKMISPFYFLSLLIIFYFTLARLTRKKYAIIFTFFLATLPFLNYHTFAAYADLPLSFYLTTAVILFFLGLRENNRAYFSLTTLFCFGAAWIKNEGLFLSLVILMAATFYLLIRKQLRKQFFIFYFLFFILLSPWLVFMFHHHLGFSNVGRDTPLASIGFGFYPKIFNYIWASFLLESGWHILWLMLILTFISWPKKFINKFNLFLSLNILGFLAFYFGLYSFTLANFKYVKEAMVLSRNLLTIAPLAIFLIANVFAQKLAKSND